jgi:hypothetical protein
VRGRDALSKGCSGEWQSAALARDSLASAPRWLELVGERAPPSQSAPRRPPPSRPQSSPLPPASRLPWPPHWGAYIQPSSSSHRARAETLKCDLRARLRPDRRCLSIVGATRHRPVLGQPLVCRTATVVSLYRSRTRQFTTSVRAILDCIWTVHDVDNPSAPTRSSAFRHRVEGSLPRKATSPNLNSKRKPEQSGPEQQRSRFLC